MTVTYLKDGRIEVDKPYDALLLQLAGIRLVNKWNLEDWRFDGKEWGVFNEYLQTFNRAYLDQTLYVPADVAQVLVYNTPENGFSWDYLFANMIADGDILRFRSWDDEDDVYMRRHNDRWNLLPEIEIEMEK